MKTALITGASSGIGFELARCFARHGYHLVVIGRNREALEKLSHECSNVTVTPFVQDLSDPHAASVIFEKIRQQGISIDILINNAGFGLWGEFADTNIEEEQKMVEIQINCLMSLTKQALPFLKKKGDGYILNVGSVYSFSPVPCQSVYAASKAFLLSFSQSLREELKESGISVTLLCPGITNTSFRTRAGMKDKKSKMSMDAKSVAEAGFHGMMKKKFLVIPGAVNKVYVFVARLLPVGLVASVVRWITYSVRKLKH